MNARGYSARDEQRLLDALGRGLLKEFPNPNRVGCPDAEVLKKIAAREMPLSEAEKWLDHLGSCSPCYLDFSQLRAAYRQRRTRMTLAAAAAMLLAAAVTGWTLLHKQNENLTAQSALLDLRDRSIARGAEPNPAEQPLEISRRVSHLKIYLPVGSSAGDYEVQILGRGEKVLFITKGTAGKQEGITSLTIDTNMSSANEGLYVLQLKKAGTGAWASYPLQVK